MNNNKQSSLDKEFVPYEEALSLKELGFDEPCFKYIYIGDTGINVDHYLEVEPSKGRNYNVDNLSISQPTFSQAFRWFREKHDLPYNLELFDVGWDYVIYLDITEEIDFNEGSWNTYEEAELACLRKLIEIVQGANK